MENLGEMKVWWQIHYILVVQGGGNQWKNLVEMKPGNKNHWKTWVKWRFTNKFILFGTGAGEAQEPKPQENIGKNEAHEQKPLKNFVEMKVWWQIYLIWGAKTIGQQPKMRPRNIGKPRWNESLVTNSLYFGLSGWGEPTKKLGRNEAREQNPVKNLGEMKIW